MLIGSMFTLDSWTREEGGEPSSRWLAVLRPDPSHAVFGGHFPGNPVVPGVCQIQVIRELAEMAAGMPLKLTTSDTIKFLSVMVPGLHPLLRAELNLRTSDGACFDITATLGNGELTFLKFRGVAESMKPCPGN